ncbi:hypothetical protein MTO96_035834 [Rhipicephalus appendiculatus]
MSTCLLRPSLLSVDPAASRGPRPLQPLLNVDSAVRRPGCFKRTTSAPAFAQCRFCSASTRLLQEDHVRSRLCSMSIRLCVDPAASRGPRPLPPLLNVDSAQRRPGCFKRTTSAPAFAQCRFGCASTRLLQEDHVRSRLCSMSIRLCVDPAASRGPRPLPPLLNVDSAPAGRTMSECLVTVHRSKALRTQKEPASHQFP